MNEERQNLRGANILVTRPAWPGQQLCDMVVSSGGIARHYPVPDISPPEETTALTTLRDSKHAFDLLIFTSIHAVEQGLCWLPALRQTALATVGEGSTAALRKKGLQVSFAPSDGEEGSEALLQHLPQHLSRWKILIIRGDSGREKLQQELSKRGAEVAYAEVYKRCRPEQKLRAAMTPYHATDIHLVVITSQLALHYLRLAIQEEACDALFQTTLLVNSSRSAQLADELGFVGLIKCCPRSSNISLLKAIKKQWQSVIMRPS